VPQSHGYSSPAAPSAHPRALFAALLLALGALIFPAQAQAEERIWSGIVLASKAEKPKAAPAELQRFAPKIERFFGYNQVELIGSAIKTIDEQSERLLVPTPHFSLNVRTHRAPGEKLYNLQIALAHDKRPIVDTRAKLAPDSPLVIRGPMHASGQVLIILQVLR
jgi:hypothetical protein